MMTKVLRSPHWWVRLMGLIGLLLATALVMDFAGRVSHLSYGYGKTQDDSASQLALLTQERLIELRAATIRDIFRYVPFYLVSGLALAGMVAATRSADEADARHWWGRLAKAPRTIAIAVVAAAVADVIETVLFRTSLTRLIDGGGEDSVELLTRITAPFTRFKFAALGAGLVLLCYQVLRSPTSTQGADRP